MCSKDEQSKRTRADHGFSNQERRSSQTNQPVQTTMNRKLYINKFDRKLREWDKEIAKLEKRAEQITKTMHQRIEELKEYRHHAAAKSSDLLQSSEEAWIEVKYGAEEALNDLKQAFRKARGKFK
jgi:hypothetical protein